MTTMTYPERVAALKAIEPKYNAVAAAFIAAGLTIAGAIVAHAADEALAGEGWQARGALEAVEILLRLEGKTEEAAVVVALLAISKEAGW